ncbi:hypothetical protein ACL03H_14140 [Saccharopolyspora sp. MS10]|uniref:hypothetical protein n=1 Tax=Saccharopolyspora sp. MS10 TaxID=3385973 RepID=UPI0039A1EFFD
MREARRHGARHTAATALPILRVPDRTAVGLMVRSTPPTKKQGTDEIRRDLAQQLTALLRNDD